MNLGYFVPFSHPNANVATKIFRKYRRQPYPAIGQDYEKRYNQKLIGLVGFQQLRTSDQVQLGDGSRTSRVTRSWPPAPTCRGSRAAFRCRTTIPKAAQQLQTGVGEGIVLFPDTDFKLKLHEAIGGGYYTVTDFGSVVQISLNMNLNARKKIPAAVLKIIDEEAGAFETHSAATGHKDHDWGIAKLKGAGVKIKTIYAVRQEGLGRCSLRDWPNERAQAVKAKKGIDMPTIMKAFIKANEGGRPQVSGRLPNQLTGVSLRRRSERAASGPPFLFRWGNERCRMERKSDPPPHPSPLRPRGRRGSSRGIAFASPSAPWGRRGQGRWGMDGSFSTP